MTHNGGPQRVRLLLSESDRTGKHPEGRPPVTVSRFPRRPWRHIKEKNGGPNLTATLHVGVY